MPPLKLFLALPSYTGHRYNAKAMLGAQECHAPFAGVRISDHHSASLLANGFNKQWADALNLRHTIGITHFCMLHDDVLPLERTWLSDLYRIMERTRAKVLSVVLPIKAHHKSPVPDVVSTALDVTTESDEWPNAAFFSLDQLEKDFPPTFTLPNLLVNTGLLLIDLREPWVSDVYFQTHEALFSSPNGQISSVTVGEDFALSRELNARGVALWVTREIPAIHYGINAWANSSQWRPKQKRGTAITEGDERVQAAYRHAKAAAVRS